MASASCKFSSWQWPAAAAPAAAGAGAATRTGSHTRHQPSSQRLRQRQHQLRRVDQEAQDVLRLHAAQACSTNRAQREDGASGRSLIDAHANTEKIGVALMCTSWSFIVAWIHVRSTVVALVELDCEIQSSSLGKNSCHARDDHNFGQSRMIFGWYSDGFRMMRFGSRCSHTSP